MSDKPPCRCGCPYTVHEHYRPSTDCGRCGPTLCWYYRPRRWWHRKKEATES